MPEALKWLITSIRTTNCC